MKVVIAIDSFKGSLSSYEAGLAISEGIKDAISQSEIEICPLADGGEGTVNAIISATGGRLCKASVTGPLGNKINATYGILPDNETAIIEISSCAGITLIGEEERNPLNTTTYGVGELITHAIKENKIRKFVIGIGGSATNDGGIGMLQALGFSFLDSQGQDVPHGAKGLKELSQIRLDKKLSALDECEFTVACDVNNPLCGKNGCSAVFARQKGATPQMIMDMDLWLSDYARLTSDIINSNHESHSGAGAAGGLGFAFLSYLKAKLCSGIELVIKTTDLENKIKNADIVITGEGCLDGQSCMGKAPIGVAKIAKKCKKPVIAFAGCIAKDAIQSNEYGIDAFFSIIQSPCTLDWAMDKENAYINLKRVSQQVFRLINSLKQGGKV